MGKPSTVRKHVPAVAALAAAALALSACGSSGPAPSKDGSDAGAATLKSAVKVGLIGSFKTAGFDASSAIAGAQAAARAINAGGGIGGHSVQIDVCNDEFTINGASACGRKMITDKVLAVTGNSIFDAGFQPVLQKAGIPIVGYTATSINSYTGSNEYLMACGTLFELYGAAYYAAMHGTKKIYVSRADVPVTEAITQSIKAGALKGGYTAAGEQTVPGTVTDISPYVQKFIASGADGVVLGYAAGTAVKFAKAAAALGATKQKLLYTAGNLQNSDIAQLGAVAPNFVVSSALPPLSATSIPGITQFLTELAAEKKSGDKDAAVDQQSETSLQAWAALHAIAKIAPAGTDPTPQNLTAALNSAKDVDMMGLIPPWTPNKAGAAPFTRLSNPFVYPEKVSDGQLMLLSKDGFDVRSSLGI